MGSSYCDYAKEGWTFCICGDFKVTVNQCLAVDQYPLPRPNDLFTTLAGGKVFAKLDLSQAYLQVLLDEKLTSYCVMNSNQGILSVQEVIFWNSIGTSLVSKTYGLSATGYSRCHMLP